MPTFQTSSGPAAVTSHIERNKRVVGVCDHTEPSQRYAAIRSWWWYGRNVPIAHTSVDEIAATDRSSTWLRISGGRE
jgi:hypothetical protein